MVKGCDGMRLDPRHAWYKKSEEGQMNDDDALGCLTERGRKALRDDSQLDIETRLCLEIMSRLGQMTSSELDEMFDELVERCGSAAKTVDMLKSDELVIGWEDERGSDN